MGAARSRGSRAGAASNGYDRPMANPRRLPEGIRLRHAKACPTRDGDLCKCVPSYEASVPLGERRKRVRRTFASLGDAKAWRARGVVTAADGLLRPGTSVTLHDAADELVDGMQRGIMRTRSGAVYKPSVVRGYESSLRLRLRPALGARKLSDVSRRDVQRLVDSWLGEGMDASTIRNSLMPLRVIYRRAIEDGLVALSPCERLRLPRVEGRRERIAGADEARLLLAALPLPDRALYSTAFFAGLRLGELRALRWRDVELARNRIHVERSLDGTGATIDTKTRAGERIVPILTGELRDVLSEHRKASRGEPGDFVFVGSSPARPVSASAVYRRVRTAWRRADLSPINLHEARHTFASTAIAAGVNAKAIATYMGHSSIQVTYDLYGKLMPGNEVDAAMLFEAYLERDPAALRPSAPSVRVEGKDRL
jgi:integrase